MVCYDCRVDTTDLFKHDLRELQHPSLITYFDLYKHDVLYVGVTEYCEGGTLAALVEEVLQIRRIGGKNLRRFEMQCAGYIYQIMEALCYLHERGMVHRAVQLTNILFADTGRKTVKLGRLTSLVGVDEAKSAPPPCCQTTVYLAPEVLRDHKAYTPAADVYALGISAFSLMQGATPFFRLCYEEAETIVPLLEEQLQEGFKLVKGYRGLTTNARNFITSCVEQDPKERGTAKDLLNHKWFDKIRKELAKNNSEKSGDLIEGTRVIVMSDDGKDLDDELAKVLTSALM